ncbi:MAG: dTMP kinase [Ancrocorticia sp.]|uniref:dTMP kinase n=1 Tax=Ancrocorticia sp. TaxID=2593684 RepID=UPI003F9289D0
MFITFEGGDGAGKSTHLQRLAEHLRRSGYEVVTTREPGGTDLGRSIRELILHGGDVSAKAEALLYAADRAHHIATLVRPALDRGAVVIGDRYLDSSVAYQGVARDLGPDEVRQLSLWATGGLMPDRTILLDVPVDVGSARVGGTLDRIEAAGREFHEAVRREFLALAEAEPARWRVVDASGDMASVTASVWGAVADLFGGDGPIAADLSGAVDSSAGDDVSRGAGPRGEASA